MKKALILLIPIIAIVLYNMSKKRKPRYQNIYRSNRKTNTMNRNSIPQKMHKISKKYQRYKRKPPELKGEFKGGVAKYQEPLFELPNAGVAHRPGDPPFKYPKEVVEKLFKETMASQDSLNTVGIYNNKYKEKKDAKVDILWVIDDSGSMGDYQRALKVSIDTFVQDFIQKNVEFRMGVATTSISYQPEIVTSDFAKKRKSEFLSKTRDLLNVGINGDGDEKGLQAMVNYFEKTNLLSGERDLIVIVISDEDDNSFHISKTGKEIISSLGYIHNKLNELIGKRKFTFYSVIETPPRKAGIRYAGMSKRTKGKVMDIRSDFHQVLLNIGGEIIESTLKEEVNVN